MVFNVMAQKRILIVVGKSQRQRQRKPDRNKQTEADRQRRNDSGSRL